MYLQISNRIKNIKSSPTLSVTAKASELKASGKDIICLGAGEPDFMTPIHIKEAAKNAIDEGFTHYTAVDGIPELKNAIINKFKRDNKLNYKSSQILVSCGAKHSIFNLMQSILNPGDEVLITSPYWVSYTDMVELTGAIPIVINTGIEQNFKIHPKQLEKAVSARCRLLILCTPSNPTGVAYTKKELCALGEILKRHSMITIMSDDIYEHIFWGKEQFTNIVMACPTLYNRTIIINGVSKAYAMTGWRIGYAAGPEKLITAMKKMQGQSTSNACSISQKAATAALNGDQSCIEIMKEELKKRHDYVYQEINNMPELQCIKSDGTFYVFFKVESLIKKLSLPHVINDSDFSKYLIETAGIALVPGTAFGTPGYMRASIVAHIDTLKIAMKRLRKVTEQI